jgi:hypothetical protein
VALTSDPDIVVPRLGAHERCTTRADRSSGSLTQPVVGPVNDAWGRRPSEGVGQQDVDRRVQGPHTDFSWLMRFSWLQRCRAWSTTSPGVMAHSLVMEKKYLHSSNKAFSPRSTEMYLRSATTR